MKTAWLEGPRCFFSWGLVAIVGLAALVKLVRLVWLVTLAGLDYLTSAPVAL